MESESNNQMSQVYYKLKNARYWMLHLVNTTNIQKYIGLNMVQEIFEMLENQLTKLENPQITLEDAEKLLKKENIKYISDLRLLQLKIKTQKKTKYKFQGLKIDLTEFKSNTYSQELFDMIKNNKYICALWIRFPKKDLNQKMLRSISRILKVQNCLRICDFDFESSQTDEVNHLFKNLFKNLPKEVEDLRLSFYCCQILTDSGFQGIAQGIQNQKQLKKLQYSTYGTDKAKCTQFHIDMISDILKEMKSLTFFDFSHNKFRKQSYMQDMENILKNQLCMRPYSWKEQKILTSQEIHERAKEVSIIFKNIILQIVEKKMDKVEIKPTERDYYIRKMKKKLVYQNQENRYYNIQMQFKNNCNTSYGK